MLSQESAFHDLAVVIDGLRAESSETRIASATQLEFISEGLGPERTREVKTGGRGQRGGGLNYDYRRDGRRRDGRRRDGRR